MTKYPLGGQNCLSDFSLFVFFFKCGFWSLVCIVCVSSSKNLTAMITSDLLLPPVTTGCADFHPKQASAL